MRLSSKTKNLLFVAGIGLVITSVLCNEWVIATISPVLAKIFGLFVILSPANKVRIWLFSIVFGIMGLTFVVIKYRSNRHLKTLSDILLGVFFSMLLLILLESLFYVLNSKGGDSHILYQQLKSRAELKGLLEKDEYLGFKLIPNNQLMVTEEKNSNQVYRAIYTIDEYGRRVTPIESPDQRKKFILFFTDSFAFGYGVNDEETLPFYVGQLTTQYKPYNYGVQAYGPQHLLAKLEQQGIQEEVKENQGLLVYIFLDGHINRAIGDMAVHNNFGEQMPYYTFDANDKLVRKGNIVSGRPALSLVYSFLGVSQVVKYFGFGFPRINEYHLQVTARIIEEARNNFKDKFKSDDFYVLIYPGQHKALIPYFENARIKYLDYSTLFDPSQKGLNIEGDGHPTAKAYKIVAEKLVKDLGLSSEK